MKRQTTARQRAISNYFRFSFLNVVSFNILAGNVIVLYALSRGASTALVGIIAASYHTTFIFSLIGRSFASRMGAVRQFGFFWFLRYLLMAPVLVTALPAFRQLPGLTLGIVTVSAFAFNVSKGIGLTTFRPIVGEIPMRKERGRFLSNSQLIVQLGSILTGISIAFLLGPEAPPGRYALLLIIGMVAGFGASYFILRLPEPADAARSFDSKFVDGLKHAFRNKAFVRFILTNMLLTFAITMTDAFLIVFFKSVYGYGDRDVVFYTAVGSLGAAAMALVSRLVIDRTGGKPLLFAFGGLAAAILIPVALAPSVSGIWAIAFPAIVFMVFAMGRFGTWTAGESYFYALVSAEDRLDVGIIFGLGTGIAGTLGSVLGGLLLSGLQSALSDSMRLPFSLYFGVAAVLMLVAVITTTRLDDVDSIPIPNALGILVSPRDLRAIRLLNRLNRTRTEPEEQRAVRALGEVSSALTVDELAQRVRSPSLLIRVEAIAALRNTPLTRQVESILISDLKNHPYTTAHLSAELLGQSGARRAIPSLRQAIDSPDYQVSARAMLALARLDDRRSIGRIENRLKDPANTRVAIYAVKALETLRSTESLPLILDTLARTSDLYIRDEYILSCARLLGFFDWFYERYLEFLDDRREALRSLDDLSQATESPLPGVIRQAISSFDEDSPAFVTVVREYLRERPLTVSRLELGPLFSEAFDDARLIAQERFRFLVLCALVALHLPAQT